MPRNTEIRVLTDPQSVARAALEEFVRLAQQAVRSNGRFTVALSGGNTPRELYSLLAERTERKVQPELPWTQTHLFFGDERYVPSAHPDSNFRMANETMIAKVPIPATNVHRVPTEETDASLAASRYDQSLVQVFNLSNEAMPRFDLILLGMGPDGHTASLFPGTRAVHETRRRVVANWVPRFNSFRVTFTRPVLNNAAQVIFLVSGGDKSDALAAVMGDGSPDEYPAKYVQPKDGQVLWLLDKAAAGKLNSSQASGN